MERGRALYVGHHGWPTKKILGLGWFEKAKIKITLESIIFWRNISISIFKFPPIFIYNESLAMKSYKFFKTCKRFGKEREKTLIQQSMRKEKLIKVRLCIITGCFIMPFKMIIICFYFASPFAAQFLLFDIRMTQEI